MRILYVLLLVFITSVGKTQKIDSLFITAALTKLQHSKEYTMQVARLMPENKYDFKPVADEMGFGEQLIHICSNMQWLCGSYLTVEKMKFDISSAKSLTKEAIIGLLNETYDYSINALKKFDTKQLADTVSFFAGPKTKLQIINLLNDHQTHHRGQVLVYLRLNSIKPPDYVGW